MMTRTAALLLFLLPACSTAPVDPLGDGSVFDGSAADDGATLPSDSGRDAGSIVGDDSGLDATLVVDDDAAVALVDAAGVDAFVGHDAATFSDDAWPGVCGDGFIDPPETCDPAYTGGSHNSISCPRAGSTGACQWCRYGLVPAGCVYGDYLYLSTSPVSWTSSCRSTTSELSWVVWHSMAERDAIIAAYRSIASGGGTTDVHGWIGLHAASDTASFLWVDDGSGLTANTILPIHNTRGPGANCMMLTVTDTDAYFSYSPCTAATGRTALCFTQVWGTPR